MSDTKENNSSNVFSENFTNFLIKTINFFDKVGKFVLENEKKISYLFLEFPEDIQKTIEMLARYEWTLDRNSPFNELAKFIKIYKSKTTDSQKQLQVDTLIMDSIDDKRIHSIFDSILASNCIKACRIQIIEETRFAYSKRKYYSANCLLITLIQGIIIDNDSSIEWPSGKALSKSIEENMDEFCKVLTFKVFKNAFYARFDLKTKKINSSISRDAILHGFDSNYGNKKVFLKLLLLLNDICLFISKKSHNALKNNYKSIQY